MSRRLDWDRTKWPRGPQWVQVPEVTDEVPTVVGPRETGRRYMKEVIAAVRKGLPLPKPSAVFLRYFKGQFPDGSVESWLQNQPEYLSALKRREAKEAAATAQKADKPSKLAPARTKRSKPPKKTSRPVNPADAEREELRKLIVRRRKEEGPRPPPIIEKRKLPSPKL